MHPPQYNVILTAMQHLELSMKQLARRNGLTPERHALTHEWCNYLIKNLAKKRIVYNGQN